jgi:vacuolar-type H+-ATPase subunit I/STV1
MDNTKNSDPADLSKTPSPVDDNKTDVVSYSSHAKLLDEKKKLQAKHSDTLEELAEYRSKEQAEAEKKLLEEKKYQELLAKKDEELSLYKSKAMSLEEERTDLTKLQYFVQGLGDSKLESKYYSLVPLDKISVNEDGSIDKDSLDSVVSEFKTEHTRLLITSKNPLPSTKVGGGSSKKLSISEWKALGTAKEMRDRYKDVDFNLK